MIIEIKKKTKCAKCKKIYDCRIFMIFKILEFELKKSKINFNAIENVLSSICKHYEARND